MNSRNPNGSHMAEDDFSDFVPEPWVIEAGLMVVVNGEVRITQKGLAAIRAIKESEDSDQRLN